MNAGAFGGETGPHVRGVAALDRGGRPQRMKAGEITFTYRRSSLPMDWIVTRAHLATEPGDPAAIAARMEAIRVEREAAQPLRVATGGSTFKNPEGHKAWRLIDAAGCRGLRLGGAMVSEKHCNFLINTGSATAADVEGLGELVRRRVHDSSGVELEWEIHRIGQPRPAEERAA
jgi:UDP-N-acetylmuramate dehydrogenase